MIFLEFFCLYWSTSITTSSHSLLPSCSASTCFLTCLKARDPWKNIQICKIKFGKQSWKPRTDGKRLADGKRTDGTSMEKGCQKDRRRTNRLEEKILRRIIRFLCKRHTRNNFSSGRKIYITFIVPIFCYPFWVLNSVIEESPRKSIQKSYLPLVCFVRCYPKSYEGRLTLNTLIVITTGRDLALIFQFQL